MRIQMLLLWTGFLATTCGAAAPKSLALGDRVELMKLPKDKVPVITWAFAFVRVSPKADRCVYIRRTGAPYKTMLQIRTFGPPVAEQAALAATPATPRCWLMGFSGRCWRADGQQVAYLIADSKDERTDMPADRRLGVAVFDWSLPVPQQSGGGAGPSSPRTATAVTFAPTGKDLWRAESDVEKYASCRIVGPRGVIYKAAGVALYHLVPSPDGRHLAWIEQPPTGRRRHADVTAAAREAAARKRIKGVTVPLREKSAVVVFDRASRKVVHRVELNRHCQDPMVWAAGGKMLCYADIVSKDRIYRLEIHALDLADGKTRLIARDAKAIGAVDGYLLANRGPGCIPMMQLASSWAPPPGTDPRPKRNEIVLFDLSKQAEPVVLVAEAFAQQLLARDLIYAEENGPDVIVWRAPL